LQQVNEKYIKENNEKYIKENGILPPYCGRWFKNVQALSAHKRFCKVDEDEQKTIQR